MITFDKNSLHSTNYFVERYDEKCYTITECIVYFMQNPNFGLDVEWIRD